MTQQVDSAEEAKAALRDLGCKVDLKELWRGAVRDRRDDSG